MYKTYASIHYISSYYNKDNGEFWMNGKESQSYADRIESGRRHDLDMIDSTMKTISDIDDQIRRLELERTELKNMLYIRSADSFQDFLPYLGKDYDLEKDFRENGFRSEQMYYLNSTIRNLLFDDDGIKSHHDMELCHIEVKVRDSFMDSNCATCPYIRFIFSNRRIHGRYLGVDVPMYRNLKASESSLLRENGYDQRKGMMRMCPSDYINRIHLTCFIENEVKDDSQYERNKFFSHHRLTAIRDVIRDFISNGMEWSKELDDRYRDYDPSHAR